ncbi:MAG: cell envelope integrity protein TolA [Limnohabitans sp.]
MTALAQHLEFAPPPPRDGASSFGLAVLVHLLLVAALTWGIQWNNSDTSVAVEAELWSALPTPAAPRAVEPDPPPPAPQAAPEPPPPKVTPKPTPPAAQREAQLAIEREKNKKLEQDKKLEEERQKRKDKELKEKKEKEKLEKEKLEKEKQAKLDKEKLEREKLEKDKKEKAKQQKAEQEAKERADAKRLEAERQTNLQRIAGMAGATGGPSDTGSALKASGPSASYAGRIRGKVKPNIVFGDDIPGNPMAEVEVKCAPDGTILSKRVIQTSGHKSWDDAVIKALEKTEKLPLDTDGRVPSVMVISFRPKD